MSPEVVSTLIGRMPSLCKPAFLPNFTRHPVKGYVFPGIIPASSSSKKNTMNKDSLIGVNGLFLSGLSQKEMDIFDWFEAEEYTRSIETIQLLQEDDKECDQKEQENTVEANVYIWTAGDELLKLEENWDYDNFQSKKLNSYLKYTVRPCKEEIERLNVGGN